MATANPFSTAPETSPQQQRQQQHIYQNLRPPTNPNPNPNQTQGVLYPVASSGRGFIPKPIRPNNNNSDHTVTVANHVGYPPRPNQLTLYHPSPRPHLDASLSNHHLGHHQHQIVRTLVNQQQQQHHHHPQIAPPVRGISVSSGRLKVAPSPSSISETNGYKHTRDKTDETIAIVRDRKVRISDGASLYSLCRSWLKNGSPEESQLQYGDGLKSLPRPLPMPVSDANVKEKEDEGDDVETDEDENVDHLSAADLLRRHVHRAKQIRSQLRDERTKRIDRYKNRLSLLLPPLVEQSRNDAPPGN